MPGKRIVPCRLGGSNSPAVRSVRHSSRTACSAAGVRVVTRSSVNLGRVNGGGRVGRSCVVASCSPGTSDGGHAQLLHREDGLAGLAVEHVGAAVLRDLRDDVAALAVLRDRDQSAGAAGKSRSQTSCLTAWKCQTRSPVAAFRHRIVFANRLSPCRFAP